MAGLRGRGGGGCFGSKLARCSLGKIEALIIANNILGVAYYNYSIIIIIIV